MPHYLDYAGWFQERKAIRSQDRTVASLDSTGSDLIARFVDGGQMRCRKVVLAIRVTLDNGETLTVDEVVFATGYRVDLQRVPFLADGLLPDGNYFADLNNYNLYVNTTDGSTEPPSPPPGGTVVSGTLSSGVSGYQTSSITVTGGDGARWGQTDVTFTCTVLDPCLESGPFRTNRDPAQRAHALLLPTAQKVLGRMRIITTVTE